MRSWRRAALWVVGIVVGFAVLFPLGYALGVPEQRGPVAPVPPVPNGSYRVYVVDWGYHTAIIVQQPIGFALGPPGAERAPFLEYAWGDRRFYMESDYQPQAVFAAVALPTSSVLYLEAHGDPPSLGGARHVSMRIVDAATQHALLSDLERTIHHGPGGARDGPFREHEGYAGRFYPAYGRYLWNRDCNWWAVTRLHAAGLAGRAAGVILSGQVRGRLRLFSTQPVAE